MPGRTSPALPDPCFSGSINKDHSRDRQGGMTEHNKLAVRREPKKRSSKPTEANEAPAPSAHPEPPPAETAQLIERAPSLFRTTRRRPKRLNSLKQRPRLFQTPRREFRELPRPPTPSSPAAIAPSDSKTSSARTTLFSLSRTPSASTGSPRLISSAAPAASARLPWRESSPSA